MTSPSEPCDWPLVYPAACSALDGMGEDERAAIERAATAWLWAWTGGRFGQCQVTLRPCRNDCAQSRGSSFFGSGPRPAWTYGQAPVQRLTTGALGRSSVMACGACWDGCSCAAGGSALRLPGPVSAITEVLVDGEALPATAYRVDNARLLVRLDGEAWPACQDMSAPSTEPGTWQVSYTQGYPVPYAGQIAAGVLACELAKSATGDSSCQLPRRVTQISRQGVSMAIAPEELDGGKTGVYLIDSWLALVNRPARGGSVRSVDIPHPKNRQTTWSAP